MLYSKIAKRIQWNLTCCEEIFEYLRMYVFALCKEKIEEEYAVIFWPQWYMKEWNTTIDSPFKLNFECSLRDSILEAMNQLYEKEKSSFFSNNIALKFLNPVMRDLQGFDYMGNNII